MFGVHLSVSVTNYSRFGEPDKQLQSLTHDTLPQGKPLGHANNNSTMLDVS